MSDRRRQIKAKAARRKQRAAMGCKCWNRTTSENGRKSRLIKTDTPGLANFHIDLVKEQVQKDDADLIAYGETLITIAVNRFMIAAAFDGGRGVVRRDVKLRGGAAVAAVNRTTPFAQEPQWLRTQFGAWHCREAWFAANFSSMTDCDKNP